jgi:uncharacterized protein (DUF305 family)
MKTTKTVLAALGALLLLTLAGLAAGWGDEASDSGSGNATDAAFVADMTAHHRGAIDMARLARTRAEHPQVRQLAAGIVAAQEREIATMRRMRADMNATGMHDEGHMGMSDEEMGMDMDMSALARARPFDRAFLDAMIPHHQGAIAMSRRLLAEGESPPLRELARDVVEAQRQEIAQMRAWRKAWYGSAPGSARMHDEHR